eukprot:COSAG02_NODE_6475_length_3550_cov_2.252970_2_plen_58_part_00
MGTLVALFLVFRMFNGWLWRTRILREINHARLMHVHRVATKQQQQQQQQQQQRHGGW